jgi:hypothetical protein
METTKAATKAEKAAAKAEKAAALVGDLAAADRWQSRLYPMPTPHRPGLLLAVALLH